MRVRSVSSWVVLVLVPIGSWATAADEFDKPPIQYKDSSPDNCVSRLVQSLQAGEQELEFTPDHGYLPALLQALQVPTESQTLVFSKTSLQRQRISPRTPRAVYFNENVYVGFCQAGEVIEISAVDQKLGTVFYTLEQEASGPPRFLRQTDNCLICHGSSRTGGIPGHLVRSLFVDMGGQPLFSAGSHEVDHTTPLKDRWGGWYVTGNHGSQNHLGNLVIRGRHVTEPVDNRQGQNLTDLSERFRVEKYLSPHSDIVALMVLEHQTLVHNRITKANFATRQALQYEATLNEALGNEEGHRLESTVRRIQSVGDDLIDALLLVDETPLSAAIRGTSGYAELFSAAGLRDDQGRSLRDLDLQRRLFKYPCSYLIYSEAFDALPDEVRNYVWQRLWEILSADEASEEFAQLSREDRLAIIEILRETKPGLPEYWMVAREDE